MTANPDRTGFCKGQKVRMLKPVKHGPKTRAEFKLEYGVYPEDTEYTVMEVEGVYEYLEIAWEVDRELCMMVYPSNGHCQPVSNFAPYRKSNEERIKDREAACRSSN
jgi:hypothetical protein